MEEKTKEELLQEIETLKSQLENVRCSYNYWSKRANRAEDALNALKGIINGAIVLCNED